MKKLFILFCAAASATAFPAAAQTFSTGTYNVRQLNAADDARGDGWQQRLPVIASLIRFHDFDIFGAQEVFRSQLEDLLGALPVTATPVSGVTTAPRRANIPSCSTSAIVSNCSTRAISGLPRTLRARTRAGMPSMSASVAGGVFSTAKPGNGSGSSPCTPITRANVRRSRAAGWCWIKSGRCATANAPCLRAISTSARRAKATPCCATRNCSPTPYDLAEIKYAWTGTENGFDPDRKTFRHIDYVFVTPGFRVLRYGILTDTYRTEEPEGSAKPFRARTPFGPLPGAGRAGFHQVKFTVT